nr:MAG TPA: hypothetical protein [Caudoviricetes sp.]
MIFFVLSKVPHFATLSDGTFFDFCATDFAIIAF